MRVVYHVRSCIHDLTQRLRRYKSLRLFIKLNVKCLTAELLALKLLFCVSSRFFWSKVNICHSIKCAQNSKIALLENSAFIWHRVLRHLNSHATDFSVILKELTDILFFYSNWNMINKQICWLLGTLRAWNCLILENTDKTRLEAWKWLLM
jgi:hypothetical protein